jgi:GH25 family lysozyme M1 (1,4-beta-N-acetylmuramidase)
MRAKIVDFSHWIGSVNYDVLAPQFDGIILKLTQGNYLLDHLFSTFWNKALKYNKLRGHYHYYDPGNKPRDQALYYYNMAVNQNAGKPDFPPILDVEMPPFVADHIHATLEEIRNLFNRTPMVYTSPSVWGSMGQLTWTKDYPLWVAQYPWKEKTLEHIPLFDSMNPWLPIGWNTWKIWQCAGDLPGATFGGEGSVDYNLFNGTKDELLAWLGKPVTDPISIPVPTLPHAEALVNGLRIRTLPTVNSQILSSLNKGNSVEYAKYTQINGDIWLAVIKDSVVVGWSAMMYNGKPLMRIL